MVDAISYFIILKATVSLFIFLKILKSYYTVENYFDFDVTDQSILTKFQYFL